MIYRLVFFYLIVIFRRGDYTGDRIIKIISKKRKSYIMEQKLISPNKWDKELHGENIYNPNIKELVGFQMTCLEKMYDYN